MKRNVALSGATQAPTAPAVRTTYVVTYTVRGREHEVYFREDFPDAESAESFMNEIERAADGRELYSVTGFFELRTGS